MKLIQHVCFLLKTHSCALENQTGLQHYVRVTLYSEIISKKALKCKKCSTK